MFSNEELNMLETACLAAATVARMGDNQKDADYFHDLADKCSAIRDENSELEVWEQIMDRYNYSESRAKELEIKVYEYIHYGYGTQEAIAMLEREI